MLLSRSYYDFNSNIYSKEGNNYMQLNFKSRDINSGQILKIVIPKIGLDNLEMNIQASEISPYETSYLHEQGNISFSIYPVLNNRGQQILFEIEDILLPKEMTLKEIEKSLGYKIKIVSEETK